MNWAEFIAENIPAPETVVVEALTGSGGRGLLYASAVSVSPCVVDETRRMARVQTGDASGKEQLSSATVWAPPETVCPAGSRVTYNGRTAKVIATALNLAHGHDLPEHLEISLE